MNTDYRIEIEGSFNISNQLHVCKIKLTSDLYSVFGFVFLACFIIYVS